LKTISFQLYLRLKCTVFRRHHTFGSGRLGDQSLFFFRLRDSGLRLHGSSGICRLQGLSLLGDSCADICAGLYKKVFITLLPKYLRSEIINEL